MDEREEFEKWASTVPGNKWFHDADATDGYVDGVTNVAFQVWQAAIANARKQREEKVAHLMEDWKIDGTDTKLAAQQPFEILVGRLREQIYYIGVSLTIIEQKLKDKGNVN